MSQNILHISNYVVIFFFSMSILITIDTFFFRGSSEQTFFYTDVTDQMKIPYIREDVQVIEYTIPQIENIIAQPIFLNGSFSFIYGLMWFLLKKVDILIGKNVNNL